MIDPNPHLPDDIKRVVRERLDGESPKPTMDTTARTVSMDEPREDDDRG